MHITWISYYRNLSFCRNQAKEKNQRTTWWQKMATAILWRWKVNLNFLVSQTLPRVIFITEKRRNTLSKGQLSFSDLCDCWAHKIRLKLELIGDKEMLSKLTWNVKFTFICYRSFSTVPDKFSTTSDKCPWKIKRGKGILVSLQECWNLPELPCTRTLIVKDEELNSK